MSDVATGTKCESCGAEISPGLLACPACHRLLHAARLSALAQEASDAEQAGNIHEMGHVDALRRLGFRATAPMFIPGLGAVIRLRQHPSTAAEDARIGLAGPLWGMGAAGACYLVFLATGIAFWAAMAHVGAWINLFNLIPLGSLDGGRGFRALSRGQAMLITAALGGAWFLTAEPMLLLVGIVGFFRWIAKPGDIPPNRPAFATFLALIGTLSVLVCVRAG